MSPAATTTLFINPSASRCGACGKNADPHEPAHLMKRMLGAGCGARYVNVSTDYADFAGLYDAVRAMRPDLPFNSPFDFPAPEEVER